MFLWKYFKKSWSIGFCLTLIILIAVPYFTDDYEERRKALGLFLSWLAIGGAGLVVKECWKDN